MRLCLLYSWIGLIESYHALLPLDLTCKRRPYQLITDRLSYPIAPDSSVATVHASIGLDAQHPSVLLTALWREQSGQQFLTVDSFEHGLRFAGRYNTSSDSWTLDFASTKTELGSRFHSTMLLGIQSTLFIKQIEVFHHSNDGHPCSHPESSQQFATCCGLCTPTGVCPAIKISAEHSRQDITVLDRGVLIVRPFACLLFPSNSIHRFWSTFTHGMNVGQRPEGNDLLVLQQDYGITQQFFYYSMHPFRQWIRRTVNFNFLDVLLIPYKQLAIFELAECSRAACRLLLQVYEYTLDDTLEFAPHGSASPTLIEEMSATDGYFRMHFDLLSTVLYLIGKRNIYASENYGTTVTRVWTDDPPSIDPLILNPIVFRDTGHIAFVYQSKRISPCCYYYAVFSKTGMHYGWRTQTFRSSTQLDEPFFFDASGSFFFNTMPPLLIVQATERSLIATPHLLVNQILGPFFIHETDLIGLFTFCSLSTWNSPFELFGSTLQFDKLGLFYVIEMSTSTPGLSFCVKTSRLSYESLPSPRQCQLILHPAPGPGQSYVQISGCSFNAQDQHCTIVATGLPNVFVDSIINSSFALGKTFQTTKSIRMQANEWYLIPLQRVDQVLDRCLLRNIDADQYRTPLIYLPPGGTYSFTHEEQLMTRNVSFLTDNDYALHQARRADTQYLTASLFDNRKAIIHRQFTRTQLSCYLPARRTITFITRCLMHAVVRLQFEVGSHLPILSPIEPPINFQLERYEAGFHSVIVYNLDDDEATGSQCDGFKNCSCVPSLIADEAIIHCAEELYTINSTVNNRVYMTISIEDDQVHSPNEQSLFLIEELANRNDFQVFDNPWTDAKRKQLLALFQTSSGQRTEMELRVWHILNASLSPSQVLFLGSNLKLKLTDEGLFHFRVTHLWGDQFCVISTDVLVMMLSSTPTVASYAFSYFLAAIVILVLMCILWLAFVFFHPRAARSDERKAQRLAPPPFFASRPLDNHLDFETLVKIREQSPALLPYPSLAGRVRIQRN